MQLVRHKLKIMRKFVAEICTYATYVRSQTTNKK